MPSLKRKETLLSAVPVGAVIKVAGFSRGIDACPGVYITVFCYQFICRQSCLLSVFLLPLLGFNAFVLCLHLNQKKKISCFLLVKTNKQKTSEQAVDMAQ